MTNFLTMLLHGWQLAHDSTSIGETKRDGLKVFQLPLEKLIKYLFDKFNFKMNA